MDLFSFHAANYMPGQGGVVKLGNIPYSITKDEVIHYMARAPGILQRPVECGIHVIMERPTAKTMDCYVEFRTQEEAVAFVRKHEYENHGKKRLGNRQVYVDLVDQEELLREMWPRSKCIVWSNGNPHRVENEDEYSTGFQGFFTTEEMVGIVRAAENPQRSPFSQKCIQRTYECMISSLFKFPWHVPSLYTLGDRNALFSAYSAQMQVLIKKVTQQQVVNIDHKLLTDFVNAGMLCAGFSQRQKAFILMSCTIAGLHQWPPCPEAEAWPFDVIGWQKGADLGYVEFTISRLHLGAQLLFTHDRSRIPQCIELYTNPTPTNNLLFNFEPSPTTQSVNFETAFYLELNFAREILGAAEQYESSMGMGMRMGMNMGMVLGEDVGPGFGMQHLMGLPEVPGTQAQTAERDVSQSNGKESPKGTTVLHDTTNKVNGVNRGTSVQNNVNGRNGYYGGYNGFMPPAPMQAMAPSFDRSTQDNDYSFGQSYGYGPPGMNTPSAATVLTPSPSQIKPSAAPTTQNTNTNVSVKPIGTAGPAAFPRTETASMNEIASPNKVPHSSIVTSTMPTRAPSFSSLVCSSDAATPKAAPTVTAAEAVHQRRISFELPALASTTNPANPSMSTPVTTTVGVGPTIWSPTSIAQADWKMPGSSGSSSPTKSAPGPGHVTATSMSACRRLSGGGSAGVIGAETGVEDSPTIGKGKLGRQGRDRSRDSSRESLAAIMKNLASNATEDSKEVRGSGGNARRPGLITRRSSKSIHRTSIAEEPEEYENQSAIGGGPPGDGLGAGLVGGGSGGTTLAGSRSAQTPMAMKINGSGADAA